ncbi:MAG TPA: AAA family ATPase [Burkholderiales bacterium]|nr:AAA family ATPase [Burkholderiales bacterium]
MHLASRVQSKTPPGQIGLSRQVHERVGHAFETELLGEFHLKGISTVEPIYVLRRSRRADGASAIEGRHRTRAPLVGRKDEFQLLGDRLSAVEAGAGGVVVIEGEPGIGKSRLLQEARAQFGPRIGWFAGHWNSYERRVGYKPFIDMVRAWLGIAATTGRLQWHPFAERMDAFLAGDSAHTTPYIGALLGIDVPAPWDERIRYLPTDVLANQVRGAMRRCFLRHALAAPLVLALEDLHWADESSLALLEHLLPLSIEAPVLFILTTRRDCEVAAKILLRLKAADSGKTVTHIVLGPLAAAESAALLDLYMEAGPSTRYLRQQILEKTGGNPFFIEELAHSIKAAGAVTKVTDGTLTGPRELAAVPETVEEVILARVDRLKVDSRQLLIRAAVIGREFLERILQMLAEGARQIDQDLIDLEHQQFIREVARSPDLAYVFCHALTQQTIYESILIETRKRLHRRVADALDSIYAGRRAEIASVLAFHYARAEAREKALEFLLEAATGAEKISADAEALRYYEEALQAYQTLDQSRAKWQQALIRRRLGVLHSRRGNFARAESYFASALALYGDRFPRPGMPARLALLHQIVVHLLNRLFRPAPLATEDVTDKDTEQHMRIYEGLAWLMMQTDQDRMLYATLRVLNLCEGSHWRESVAKALGAVGFTFNVLGMHKAAHPYHRRAAIIAGQGSDLSAQALVTDLYGGHYLFTGNWDLALESLREAQDLSFRIGDLDTWVSACGWQCVLLCEQGELGEVQALVGKLLTVGRDTGFAVADRWGRLFEGAYLRRAGRPAQAEAALRQALDAATACGDAVTQVDANGELGVLALRTGRGESGQAYLRMGQALVRQRRIRIQSIVAIEVGLAEASLSTMESDRSADLRHWWSVKRRCSKALATARRYSVGTVWALRLLARVDWLRGEKDAAKRNWQEALDLSHRLKARYEEALTLMDRGTMTGDDSDVQDGKALFLRCISLVHDLRRPSEAA